MSVEIYALCFFMPLLAGVAVVAIECAFKPRFEVSVTYAATEKKKISVAFAQP